METNMELAVLQPNLSMHKRYNALTYRSKKVYSLIKGCIDNKIVLDQAILEQWFLEDIVKPRNRKLDGKYIGKDERGYNVYEKISEYDFLKNEQQTQGYIRSYWLSEAKGMVKFNIGVLVLKGMLAVMPKISLENIPDTAKELTT